MGNDPNVSAPTDHVTNKKSVHVGIQLFCLACFYLFCDFFSIELVLVDSLWWLVGLGLTFDNFWHDIMLGVTSFGGASCVAQSVF